MQFSEKEKHFLTYCGNSENFEDTKFQKLIETVFSRFNNALKLDDKHKTEFGTSDVQTVLCLFLTVSAKENLDSTSFYSFLYELNWNKDRITKLWNLYENKQRQLKWSLASTIYNPPHIVNIEWKVDYIVKNFGGVRSGSLCYIITLYMQKSEGRTASLTFICSLAQLTHLVNQLRQATSCIKNYASKS